MTTIVVTKDDTGKLTGFTEADKRAYRRFKKIIDGLQPGELFNLEHWFARTLPVHKRYFAMLGQLFESQEFFDEPEHLRKWAQVGAGYCLTVPGPHGQDIAIPLSINFRTLEDEPFRALVTRVEAYLRSTYATHTLWPHLSPFSASQMMEAALAHEQRG